MPRPLSEPAYKAWGRLSIPETGNHPPLDGLQIDRLSSDLAQKLLRIDLDVPGDLFRRIPIDLRVPWQRSCVPVVITEYRVPTTFTDDLTAPRKQSTKNLAALVAQC
jgi:hypothetical protein